MIKSFKDTNNKKITNPTTNKEEAKEEVSLRPQSFNDFIGQQDVLDNLRVSAFNVVSILSGTGVIIAICFNLIDHP